MTRVEKVETTRTEPRRKNRERGSTWALRSQKTPRARAAVVELRTQSFGPRARAATVAAMDDVELLGEVLRSDQLAWNVFFKRFRGLILSCAVKVSSRAGVHLSSDDMMDVLGEVSVNLVAHDYRRLRLYRVDGGCTVATWIGVIATSTTRDHLRRARRHRLDPVSDTELDRVASPSRGPEERLMDRQRRRFVDKALAGLSKRDRQFAVLYFAEAKTPEEVAQTMGVSVSTVYSKKAKIKAKLIGLAAACEA